MFSRYFLAPVAMAFTFSAFSSAAVAMETDVVAQGKKVYSDHCQHCHGEAGDGQGFLVNALKVKPADLTTLDRQGCVTRKVLGAVLGRHKSGYADSKMPLLKEVLSLENVYAVSAYVETLQK
jgi:mono/diheme cytochrome c family protein